MAMILTESVVDEVALASLESLGYAVLHLPAPQSTAARQAGGPDIALRIQIWICRNDT